MLHYFTFRNFYSFAHETMVDFRVPKSTVGPGVTEDRLSTAMAVIGANGSGKTSLIKALGFVHWFVRYSSDLEPDEQIPFELHFFSGSWSASFEADQAV